MFPCTWTKEDDAIIISNKKDNKTNMNIATLLEGKSEAQVRNHSSFLTGKGTLKTIAKKPCTWTKEDDAIIAMLLEGKSEAQVRNHSSFLTEKGTLKTIAKKCFWTKEDDDIIINNRKDNRTNKDIAQLLNGRSETQVKNRVRRLIDKEKLVPTYQKLSWTKEEDDIIISNKNDSNTIKYIATLLEGKSENQVQYRLAFLISKEKLDPSYLKLSWTKEDDDIIINNKKDNTTNKDIAQLLNGKTKIQVKQRSAILIKEGRLDQRQKMISKKCLWTEEEDAIIISNKIDNNTHKFIATLLEGRSESQVQYRSRILIDKGILKTVAKKKKAPITKVRFHINK
jgi:DNA-binding Lrp family transcriptional regulator